MLAIACCFAAAVVAAVAAATAAVELDHIWHFEAVLIKNNKNCWSALLFHRIKLSMWQWSKKINKSTWKVSSSESICKDKS